MKQRRGIRNKRYWIYPAGGILVVSSLYLEFKSGGIPTTTTTTTVHYHHHQEDLDEEISSCSSSKNQSLLFTEECMQENAFRIARAFPYKPKDSWCVSTTTQGENSKNKQNQYQGLLYIKVPKVSSSTVAGVTLRIHNHTGCEIQWEHQRALHYNPRSLGHSFLLGSMRNPKSRDLSHIQFFQFGREFSEFGERIENGTYQVSTQDYYDHGLYWKEHQHSMHLLKGQGGYQYTWLTLESIKINEIYDESYLKKKEQRLKNPRMIHTKLQRLVQDYSFFIVVERMDESLVALALIMGLELHTMLIAASAKVSGSYYLNYRGKTAGQCVKGNDFSIPEEIHNHMKESHKYLGLTYADQILYRASNKSLDLTIQETIGYESFTKSLKEYKSLKEKAIKYCGIRLQHSGCYSNGTPIFPVEPCYVEDYGCGYQCLDEVVKKIRSGEL